MARKASSMELSLDALARLYSDESARSERVIGEIFGKMHPGLGERRNVVETVYGTLKMQGRIDYVLGKLGFAIKRASYKERALLRMTVYRRLFTDISEPTLMKQTMGIMHFLQMDNLEDELKIIIENAPKVEYPERNSKPLEFISIYYSHPLWLVKMLADQMGIEETARFCKANNEEPPLTIRANTLKVSREELAEQLAKEGFDSTPTKCSPFGLEIKQKGDIYKTRAFSEGLFEAQDEASQLVTLLASMEKPGKVVDACAGSGGKTLFISAMMHNKGKVIAVELYENKILTLKKRARRAGAYNIEPITSTDPDLAKLKADVVIIDSPCTGTGTLRRNPESRWKLEESDVEELSRKELDMMHTYSALVRPGGRLVYMTCSVLKQEDEDVVAKFLEEGSFKALDAREFLPKGCSSFVKGKYFRAFPQTDNTDGFFGAALERVR